MEATQSLERTPGESRQLGLEAQPVHTLDVAARGELHTVVAVAGSDETACRLYEMGLGEGASVVVEKAGNPAILRVGNTKLAVGREVQARVSVRCLHVTSGKN